MSHQHIHKSTTRNPSTQPQSSHAEQDSCGGLTQVEENAAFQQDRLAAFGLQLKAKLGSITPLEQNGLGVLQAKRQDFWAQRLARASWAERMWGEAPFGPNIANNIVGSANATAGSAIPIQAKLAIGQSGDKYEQEADRLAVQVVEQINTPVTPPSTQGLTVQRQEDDEELQAKPSISVLQRSPLLEAEQQVEVTEEVSLQAKSTLKPLKEGGEVSTNLETGINIARGNGQQLDGYLQRSMGQVMGADFSRVRVHTDDRADLMNQSIQAKAFTTKQDIFFRKGEYIPSHQHGQELIAHELTHVMQQTPGVILSRTHLNPMTNPLSLSSSETAVIQRSYFGKHDSANVATPNAVLSKAFGEAEKFRLLAAKSGKDAAKSGKDKEESPAKKQKTKKSKGKEATTDKLELEEPQSVEDFDPRVLWQAGNEYPMSTYDRPKWVEATIIGQRRTPGGRRPDSLATRIGHLGEQERAIFGRDPRKSYAGGHLIADRFLDEASNEEWNIAPMATKANVGVYSNIENAIAEGAVDKISKANDINIPIQVRVEVDYKDDPYTVTVQQLLERDVIDTTTANKIGDRNTSLKFNRMVPYRWRLRAEINEKYKDKYEFRTTSIGDKSAEAVVPEKELDEEQASQGYEAFINTAESIAPERAKARTKKKPKLPQNKPPESSGIPGKEEEEMQEEKRFGGGSLLEMDLRQHYPRFEQNPYGGEPLVGKKRKKLGRTIQTGFSDPFDITDPKELKDLTEVALEWDEENNGSIGWEDLMKFVKDAIGDNSDALRSGKMKRSDLVDKIHNKFFGGTTQLFKGGTSKKIIPEKTLKEARLKLEVLLIYDDAVCFSSEEVERQKLRFAAEGKEEDRSFEKPTQSIVEQFTLNDNTFFKWHTIGDGNCAFNGFGLALVGLVLQNRLSPDVLTDKLMLPSEDIDKLAELAKAAIQKNNVEASMMIQEMLAPELRDLAVELLQNAPEKHEIICQDFLNEVDRLMGQEAQASDIFRQMHIINEKMQIFASLKAILPLNLVKSLAHLWFNRHGMDLYLSYMSRELFWAGATELSVLAEDFGVQLDVFSQGNNGWYKNRAVDKEGNLPVIGLMNPIGVHWSAVTTSGGSFDMSWAQEALMELNIAKLPIAAENKVKQKEEANVALSKSSSSSNKSFQGGDLNVQGIITKYAKYRFGNVKVGEMSQFDLTQLDPTLDPQKDKIGLVNAANAMLKGGGGIDAAIHAVAGQKELDKQVEAWLTTGTNQQDWGTGVGKAMTTTGGKLKDVHHIIHAVGPDASKGESIDELYNVCLSVLNEAEAHQLTVLIFCNISSAIFGFSPNETASIIHSSLEEILKLVRPSHLKKVIFNNFPVPSGLDRLVQELKVKSGKLGEQLVKPEGNQPEVIKPLKEEEIEDFMPIAPPQDVPIRKELSTEEVHDLFSNLLFELEGAKSDEIKDWLTEALKTHAGDLSKVYKDYQNQFDKSLMEIEEPANTKSKANLEAHKKLESGMELEQPQKPAQIKQPQSYTKEELRKAIAKSTKVSEDNINEGLLDWAMDDYPRSLNSALDAYLQEWNAWNK